jgi:excisionase family DNA binding protein
MKESIKTAQLFGEAFLEAIRLAVREEIRAASNQAPFSPKHDQDTARKYLTVKEAAIASGLGASTIRLLIRKRKLQAQKVGRRVLIKRSDLENFLESHPIRAI